MENQNRDTLRPDKLYRGVKMSVDKIDTIDEVRPIRPYHPPIYDESGRPLVGDGNEYGVYMSDNPTMIDQVYSNPERGDGDIIEGVNPFGYDKTKLRRPALGVKYEISSDGIDIREPYITSSLKGHYNNGFIGREWIADEIPEGQYRVASIKVGPDAIHSGVEFTVEESIENTVELVKNEIESRMGRLAILGAIINLKANSDAMNQAIDYINRKKNIADNGSDILQNLYDYEFGQKVQIVRAVDKVLCEKYKIEKDRLKIIGEVHSGELSNIKSSRQTLRKIDEDIKYNGLTPEQACKKHIDRVSNKIIDETDPIKMGEEEQEISNLNYIINIINQLDINDDRF